MQLLVAAVLVLPLVVGVVRALIDQRSAPSGDVSLMEVRVRDVGPATPLLGSYGRYGFNHPGPLLFYVLAIPYRLAGSRFVGMEVGTLLLGGLSVAAIAWVAHRRGGPRLLLWAGLLLGVLVQGIGPTWLADPWEPHGLLLPCAALVVLAFDAFAGRPWTLLAASATAALLAQAQATLLPFAVAMGGLALTGTVAVVVRAPDRRAPALRAIGAAVLLTGVLWVPTVVEQLTREPGNLTAMSEALDRPEPVLGLADGARLVAMQLGERAPWLGWATPLVLFEPTVDVSAAPLVPVGAVALALALVVAAWRRLPAGLLALTAAVAAFVGALALSRLIGPPYVWIPQWTRSLGFACWLAVGWVVATALPKRARDLARAPTTAVLLVTVVALSAANALDAATDEGVDDPLARTVAALVAEAAPALEALDDPVLASSTATPDVIFGGGAPVGLEALVLRLELAGVTTVVDEAAAGRFGPERARPTLAGAELRLALERSPVPAGFERIATADPLTEAQRAERLLLLESIGLGDEATMGDVVDEVFLDPSLRQVGERLSTFSDLPRFALLLADPRP